MLTSRQFATQKISSNNIIKTIRTQTPRDSLSIKPDSNVDSRKNIIKDMPYNNYYNQNTPNNNKPAVKSTSCSSYNPELKDGRGGNASERGPEIWVKKWVD